MASDYGQMPYPTQDAGQGANQDNGGQGAASMPGMGVFDPSQFISFSDVPVDVRTPEQKEAERQERERQRQREEALRERAEEEQRRQQEAERRQAYPQEYQQGYPGNAAPGSDAVPGGPGDPNYGRTLADTIQWPSELQVDWPAWNDENLTQVAHGKTPDAQGGQAASADSTASAASDQFVGSNPQAWQGAGASIPTSEMPAIFTAGGLDPYSGMEGMDDPEPQPQKKRKHNDGEKDKAAHKQKKESFWDRRRREKDEKEAQKKAEEERKKAEEERKRQAIENGAESQMMWGF